MNAIFQRPLLLASIIVGTTMLNGCPGEETPEPLTVHTFTSSSEGFDTNTWWIDTGAEVVVVDAQFTPEIAQDMLAEIQAATDSPIRYVVVTHPNPDKFNGATVFQEAGATLVASQATTDAMPGVHAYKKAYFVGIGMFTEETYPDLPTVDLTFQGSLTLELDADADITLMELESSGVSSTQTVVLVPDQQVLVGDLVAHEVHAWLEGGIVDGAPSPDLEAWGRALDELAELAGEEATVYPGRGTAALVAEAVPTQKAYLETMDALVLDYVAGLDDPTAELTGENAADHYVAIAAQASEAYPSYGLSYLIEYGVYGLALAHAATLEE